MNHRKNDAAPRAREIIDRAALQAALRKAALLDRVDPLGDPYGAAGQALEEYAQRAEQIVAGGEDVTGWIGTVTERRWINELRYQARRRYERLDAPVRRGDATLVGEIAVAREPAVEDIVASRERLRGIASEQYAAMEFLARQGVQRRHLNVVSLALSGDIPHHEIASRVNATFSQTGPIQPNTVTQIVSRQRDRLAETGSYPSVVARLRRARRGGVTAVTRPRDPAAMPGRGRASIGGHG